MRLPLAALLLFASTAVAQTTGTAVTFTTSSTTSGGTTVLTAKGECTTPVRFSWTRTGNLCTGGSLFLYVSRSSCGSEPAITDLKLATITDTTASGTVTFTVQDVLAALATPTTCETQKSEISFNVCASAKTFLSVYDASCSTSFSSVGSPAFVVKFDPAPPAKPSIGKIIARDSALSVQVDGVEAKSTVVVEVTAIGVADGGALPDGDAGTDDAGTDAGEDAGVDAGDIDAGADAGADAGLADAGSVSPTPVGTTLRFRKAAGEGNVVADGLVNGVTYRVQAQIVDEAGNESDLSDAVEGTPVKSNGLGDAYVDAGGEERGGCAATGGGIAGGAVLAMLGIWLSTRRKVS